MFCNGRFKGRSVCIFGETKGKFQGKIDIESQKQETFCIGLASFQKQIVNKFRTGLTAERK